MTRSKTFRAIAEAIGEEAARRLCREMGGEALTVPAHPDRISRKAEIEAYAQKRGVSMATAYRHNKRKECK